MKTQRQPACLASLVLLAALSGCARPPADAGPPATPSSAAAPLRVVATTSLLGDLAGVLGGPDITVEALMGPGVDPHLYRARAGDIEALLSADLVLYHGLHLEGKLAEVLEQTAARGRPTLAATGGLAAADIRDAGGAPDPHVWFDVRRWMNVADHVAGALAEHDPARAEAYQRRLAAYRAELEALDAWCAEQAATLPAERRVLVTAHDAFGYFGEAYGFEVHGLQGVSTATEAGTADVGRLAAFLAERRVPAVFVESSVPARTIEALRAAAAARGWTVRLGGQLFSDALGEAGGPAGTYLGMVRANMTTIVKALAEEADGGDS